MKAKDLLLAVTACVLTGWISESCHTARERVSETRIDIDSLAIARRSDLGWMLEQGIVEMNLTVENPRVEAVSDSMGRTKKRVSARNARLHISGRKEREMVTLDETRDSTVMATHEKRTASSNSTTDTASGIRKALIWIAVFLTAAAVIRIRQRKGG